MQPPGLTTGMINVFEVGHAGIVVPNLAPSPGADVKDMVEGGLGYAAMTDSQDDFFQVAFHQLLTSNLQNCSLQLSW